MKPEDRERFAVAMAKTAVALKGEMSEIAGEVYWEALEDLGIGELEAACLRARKELEFFPVPSKLRELAGRKARREFLPPYLQPWRDPVSPEQKALIRKGYGK